MNARRFKTGFAASALVALAACAPMTVRSDYDELASFSELRTYRWIEREYDAGEFSGNPAVNNPILDRRVRAAVDAELGRRGFIRVSSDPADFWIAYHMVAEQRTATRYYTSYGSYGSFGHHGFNRRFHGGGFGYYDPAFHTTIYEREWLEGTLVLDVVDGRRNELIWRGWARQDLQRDPDPERLQIYVTEAVRKILEEFPPEGAGQREREPTPLIASTRSTSAGAAPTPH